MFLYVLYDGLAAIFARMVWKYYGLGIDKCGLAW